MPSKTGARLAEELLMSRRIWLVAVCCSRASAWRFSASARRFSRSRTLPPSRVGAVREGVALAFAFASLGRRGIRLSWLRVVQRPMTGYANGPPWTRGDGGVGDNVCDRSEISARLIHALTLP